MLLVAFAAPNLLGARNQVQVNSAVPMVIADLKQQQLRSMLGETQGRSTTDTYGIHFETTTYTLFHGSSYAVSEPTNSIVQLGGALTFSSVNIPGNVIIFGRGSGEVIGYSNTQNMFGITNPGNNQTRTVTFNTYGVVTQIQ